MWKSFILTMAIVFLCNSMAYTDEGDDKTIPPQSNEMNLFPPSPEAASLGEYANTQVSYFTGTPNISIPIWTVEGRSLSQSISLNYDATGVKVADRAEKFGLKWSLSCGGAISRTVRCIPDETPNHGFINVGNSYGFDYTDPNFLSNMTYEENEDFADKLNDSKPDIFFVNCDGYSGKMFFGNDLNLHFSPFEYTKVEKTLSDDKLTEFIITMNDGTTYYFGGGDSYIETSRTSKEKSLAYYYNSCWYLRMKVSPDKKDTIYFEYESGYKNIAYPVNYSLSCQNKNNQWMCNPNPNAPPSTYYTTKYPKTIESSKCKVVFDDDKEINIYKKENEQYELITRFELSYSLFNEVETTIRGYECGPANRIRLDKIQEFDEQNVSKPPYVFEYNSTPLPHYHSQQIDEWGYYNGAVANDNLYALCPDYIIEDQMPSYNGQVANRNTNESFCLAGILTKFTYPTGGYTQFNYGVHELGEKDVGGARIESIIINDGNNTETINYSYDDAVQFSSQSYNYSFTNYTVAEIGTNPSWPSPREIIEDCYQIFLPNSQYPLGSSNGSHIGYQKVTIDYGTNGKIVNEYTTHSDNSPYYSWTPAVDKSQFRGNLEKSTMYSYVSENLYEPRSITEYTYELPCKYTAYGIGVGYISSNCLEAYTANHCEIYKVFGQERFTLSSYAINLTSKKETFFDTDNTGNNIVREETYTYDDEFNLMSEKKVYYSEDQSGYNHTLVTYYTYPFDHMGEPPNENIYNDMVENKNMVNYKISEETYLNDQELISGIRNNYAKFNSDPNQIYINTKQKLETDGASSEYVDELIINSYNQFSKPVQYHKPEDIPTSISWDDNGNYPTAKYTNAGDANGTITFLSDLESAYTSFEFYDTDEWELQENCLNNGENAKAGTGFAQLANNQQVWRAFDIPEEMINSGYKATCWVKGNSDAYIKLEVVNEPSTIQQQSASGIGEWELLEVVIDETTINSFKNNGIELKLTIGSTGSLQADFDELLFYPDNAYPETYTYDIIYGTTSHGDVNRQINYFDYDHFGRLELIKDHKEQITDRFRYNYESAGLGFKYSDSPVQGQQMDLTAFSSIEPGQNTDITYQWIFPGSTDEGIDVLYTPSSSGEIDIEVRVLVNGVLRGNHIKTIYIEPAPPLQVNIITGSMVEDLNGVYCLGENIFTADVSGGSGNFNYQWKIIENGINYDANDNDHVLNYCFTCANTYIIECYVTDNTYSNLKVYTYTPYKVFNHYNCSPDEFSCIEPFFSYEPNIPLETETITFEADYQDGSATYSWDFGDQGTSNIGNPDYSFATHGSYNIKLEVSDGIITKSYTRTIDVHELLPPQNLEATKNGTNIDLEWDHVLGATEYEVYRSIDGNTFTILPNQPTNVNFFFDENPVQGINDYKVKALNSDLYLESGFSNIISVIYP